MASIHRVNHEPVFLLSATPWRESSLWLEVFSRSYGRIALLARSARKRQSELRGVLVPFLPFSASWYGENELKTLHRAEWLGGWQTPQGRALFSGLYLNELLLKLTAREDPHPELYDVFYNTMKTIGGKSNHVAALRLFEWKLLHILGYAPSLQYDTHHQEIQAEKNYYLSPEQLPELVTEDEGMTHSYGQLRLCVRGSTLLDLHNQTLHHHDGLTEALQLNRMLLDYYLPDGIQSRKILQQLNRMQTAWSDKITAEK